MQLPLLLASFCALSEMRAQRVYERGPELMFEDAQGRPSSLGPGFNAVPISDHKFLLIRGARMGYGEESSCERPAAKNRVVVYDTQTNKEFLIFDKPLSDRMMGHDAACVYEHADLAPTGATLYIVSPSYATAGCLAIIDLASRAVRYVPGVMDVFVVRGGSKAGDLIYSRRLERTKTRAGPSYPYIHARPDGSQIAIISNEDLVLGVGNAPAPGSLGRSEARRRQEWRRGTHECVRHDICQNVEVYAAKFRIGLVQMACSVDPNENLAKAEWRIREAAARGAQIVCLQELFRSQYFCREENAGLFDLAESIPGPSTEALGRLAGELGVVVVGSVFERRAAGVYHNTAVIIDADGALAGIYRKMHIPDDPLYFEKYYFTPGDLGFRSFDTRFGRVAALVCWDQWYPEAARLAALSGAQVLFYPTAIGWHPAEKEALGAAQHDAWRTIQRGHAIANGIYVAAVNRVGFEGPPENGLDFWGGSFVADPFGQVVAQALHDREEILLAECDTRRIEDVRRNWPFLRDRRIDAYGDITRRVID